MNQEQKNDLNHFVKQYKLAELDNNINLMKVYEELILNITDPKPTINKPVSDINSLKDKIIKLLDEGLYRSQVAERLNIKLGSLDSFLYRNKITKKQKELNNE